MAKIDNTIAVRNLIEGWATLDIDFMMDQFAEDAIFENVPMELIVGKPAIRKAVGAFLEMCIAAPWELRNIAVAENGTVLTERADRFHLKNGSQSVSLVMGAFELDGSGRIAHWRDYFDLGDWNRQVGMDPDFGRKRVHPETQAR